MSPSKNIILTGFMGCGKTTAGRLLAAELGGRLLDTDRLIVQQAGQSIAQIFALQGEAAFRIMERQLAVQLAAQLAQGKNLVIATGGKMMLDPVNVKVLSEHGVIVCLTASAEEILRRVQGDTDTVRPLLGEGVSISSIRQLLAERRAGYAAFPQVSTDGREPGVIVQEILAVVQKTLEN